MKGRDFYVLCVFYDGFDETEPFIFPDCWWKHEFDLEQEELLRLYPEQWAEKPGKFAEITTALFLAASVIEEKSSCRAVQQRLCKYNYEKE